jgi:hypothetical protein
MFKRSVLAAMAALALASATASANHEYRWLASSGGGNGQQMSYRMVRVSDPAPYALTGKSASGRLQLQSNAGGNASVQFFVRSWN